MAKVTTAEEKNCVITVTHKIHFVNQGIPAADYDRAVNKIKDELKRVWSDPKFKYKCCQVKFKFEYSNSAGNDVDDKNLHSGRGVSSQSGLGPDKTNGTWFPVRDRPSFDGVAAHETGHEMGMTDKYECYDAAGHKIDCYVRDAAGNLALNPNYSEKRPPNGYPNDGIAFDSTGTPKQKDIDEIIGKLGVTCPERCCKKCLIDRSVSGTAMESNTNMLRVFRDNVVLKSKFASTFELFLSAYYLGSTRIVNVMENHRFVHNAVKFCIAFPFVMVSTGIVSCMRFTNKY